ncbi:MAG: L-serine ammonia-lyase, iron-sulfur-dependent subunit beta [Clostridiales bacterium]|nr:L-serine ammonia-lyase, iron-sulfur-dependent subunit beta [Clostridiales bacterium]
MKNYSFTDILGPIMIGPSSSHTAGAAKLGLVAKHINNKDFSKVTFQLHGSFAMTYKGHGTDKALIGGVLGFQPDDIRLRNAYKLAEDKNIQITFEEIDLEGEHANTVNIVFYNKDETINQIIGSSVGGGDIIIKKINDFNVNFKGDYPTIIVKHMDKKGILSLITTILATRDINIATMEVSRTSKNKNASIIIECDQHIPSDIIILLENIPDVLSVKSIDINKGDQYV